MSDDIRKELDVGVMEAMMQGVMNAGPMGVLQLLNDQRMEIKASFQGIPLDISLKFQAGQILARIRYPTEEKPKNGDQSKAD